jgi:hypothetical protein
MTKPLFVKTVVGELVNSIPPGAMNTFSTVGDVNGSGLMDIVVSGRNGRLVWLENKGDGGQFEQHLIDWVDRMECGGSVYDLTGNGHLDVINGGDSRSDEIHWWENPGTPGTPWRRRLIARTSSQQFHDTIIGDVTGNGTESLVFTNQGGATALYRVPLPQDPRVSPWPGIELIADGKTEPNPWREGKVQPEEGLAVGDLDGDGLSEIVCGTHWYKHSGERGTGWVSHKYTAGYITTKVCIGDIDGDGKNEIVLSEGDPCVYGRVQGGKLAWFKPGRDIGDLWDEFMLEDYLLDAHSLQLADICGHGRLDILVGEVGLPDRTTDAYLTRPPWVLVFENEGNGSFVRHVVDEGTGIHDALLADMRGSGVLDIVGKPLHGPEKWKVHVYYNEGRNREDRETSG